MRKFTIPFLAALLLAAAALPALAASSAASTRALGQAQSYRFAGSVSAVGATSLTIGVLWAGPHDGTLNGQSLTVAVGPSTRITDGKDRTPVALGSIQSGALVSVVARGSDPTSLTAATIHVRCNCHWIGGTISSVGTNSITVQVKRTGPYDTVLAGKPVTLVVNSSTTYLQGRHITPITFSDLKPGYGVGVVFGANGFFKAPGFDPATATFTAKRVHQWGHRQVPLAATDGTAAASTA